MNMMRLEKMRTRPPGSGATATRANHRTEVTGGSGGVGRLLVIGVLMLIASATVHGLKAYIFSLPELVREADVIVAARLFNAGKTVRAEVEETFKGAPVEVISVVSDLSVPRGKMEFTEGEKALLFVRNRADGNRETIGYGDQGKWPRQEGKWPYTSTHVASFKETAEVIRLLVNLQSSKDTNAVAGQVSEMLKSGDSFKQLIGLEFLELRGNGALLKHLAGAVRELQLSTNEVVRAQSIRLQRLQTEK